MRSSATFDCDPAALREKLGRQSSAGFFVELVDQDRPTDSLDGLNIAEIAKDRLAEVAEGAF